MHPERMEISSHSTPRLLVDLHLVVTSTDVATTRLSTPWEPTDAQTIINVMEEEDAQVQDGAVETVAAESQDFSVSEIYRTHRQLCLTLFA